MVRDQQRQARQRIRERVDVERRLAAKAVEQSGALDLLDHVLRLGDIERREAARDVFQQFGIDAAEAENYYRTKDRVIDRAGDDFKAACHFLHQHAVDARLGIVFFRGGEYVFCRALEFIEAADIEPHHAGFGFVRNIGRFYFDREREGQRGLFELGDVVGAQQHFLDCGDAVGDECLLGAMLAESAAASRQIERLFFDGTGCGVFRSGGVAAHFLREIGERSDRVHGAARCQYARYVVRFEKLHDVRIIVGRSRPVDQYRLVGGARDFGECARPRRRRCAARRARDHHVDIGVGYHCCNHAVVRSEGVVIAVGGRVYRIGD